jgi:hypothetical protein
MHPYYGSRMHAGRISLHEEKPSRSIIRGMAVIHISEAEAARDFPGLLARVRAGAEIVIDDDASPAVMFRVTVRRVAAKDSVRRLSESLRMAREHGSTVTLDGGFAADLEAAVESHPESLESSWD